MANISIRTMRAAGLNADQIVRVLETDEEERLLRRREQNRINKRNQRSRQQIVDDCDDIADTNRIREINQGSCHHVSADIADRRLVPSPLPSPPSSSPLTLSPITTPSPLSTPSPTNSLFSDSPRAEVEIVARRIPPIRATRIPEGWEPTPEVWKFAYDTIGFNQARQEYAKFTDYWRARAGPNAVKLDWAATWRNWIRKAAENGKINGKRTIMEACDDLLARVRAFDEPAPGELFGGAGSPAFGLLPKG